MFGRNVMNIPVKLTEWQKVIRQQELGFDLETSSAYIAVLRAMLLDTK